VTDFPGLDLAALHKYLQAAGVEVSGELRAELISGGKSNLTYGIFDDNSKWILRRPPTAGLTPSAHDVAREFRITSALQNTAVPVAPTVVLCEDASVMGASFTVVEFVTGQVIRTKTELEAVSAPPGPHVHRRVGRFPCGHRATRAPPRVGPAVCAQSGRKPGMCDAFYNPLPHCPMGRESPNPPPQNTPYH